MSRVIHGDCLDVMRQLAAEGVLVDSVVTDPPYGLGFMGKKWDSPGSFVERKAETRNRFDHVGGNHNPSNAQDAARTRRVEAQKFGLWCEEWAEAAFALMRPGAHLVAFGGSRTFHRVACAIEDAGLEIRDTIMWITGQGFPKSRNLDGDWKGWGTALKPAHEPIILARKPLSEPSISANVLAHGTGAINVDGCRVETSEIGQRRETAAREDRENWRITGGSNGSGASSPAGRWPANVCHDSSDEVLEAFAAFGESKSSDNRGVAKRSGGNIWQERGGYYNAEREVERFGYTDAGSPARFFYSSKASATDRAGSLHPTVKPVSLMRWLCRLVTPPGGLILDPFAGSGTTLQAAAEEGFRAIGIEREAEYVADIERRMAKVREDAGLFAEVAA